MFSALHEISLHQMLLQEWEATYSSSKTNISACSNVRNRAGVIVDTCDLNCVDEL